MPLILPDLPPASVSFRRVRAGNQLVPAIGGAEQDLARKGSRYEIAYVLDEMDWLEAMDWADLLVEGQTVVIGVPQPGLDLGAPGATVADGAGQAGSFLALRNMTPAYAVRRGQFFSHIAADGQRFLYRARAQAVADGAGDIVIPLSEMLRRTTADGDVIDFDPKVEGLLRDVGDLTVETNHDVSIRFSVRERE